MTHSWAWLAIAWPITMQRWEPSSRHVCHCAHVRACSAPCNSGLRRDVSDDLLACRGTSGKFPADATPLTWLTWPCLPLFPTFLKLEPNKNFWITWIHGTNLGALQYIENIAGQPKFCNWFALTESMDCQSLGYRECTVQLCWCRQWKMRHVALQRIATHIRLSILWESSNMECFIGERLI